MLAAVAAAAIAAMATAAAAQGISGRSCSPSVDQFACEGSTFLACSNSGGVWVFQNSCTTPCTENPAFSQFCYRNSLPGGVNVPSSSPSPPSKTQQSTFSQPSTNTISPGTPTSITEFSPSFTRFPAFPSIFPSDPASPTSLVSPPPKSPSHSSSSSLSETTIIIISVCVGLLVITILAIILYCCCCYRRSRHVDGRSIWFVPVGGKARNKDTQETGMSSTNMSADTLNGSNSVLVVSNIPQKSASPSVAQDVGKILERKFVVTTDYEPVASDELRMRVGDTIVLDLLFNDGWAKGKNESTKQEGILPVACITQSE